MEKRKEYRSAVRSRRMIRSAFLELLREKPCEKITVTDIVNRADINRSTFYAHYPDVRGLVEGIVGELIDHSVELAREMDIQHFFDDPLPYLQHLNSYGLEDAELYKLLSQSDFAPRQMEQVKLTLSQRLASAVEIPEHIRASVDFQIQMNFFLGGIFNIYVLWLQGNIHCTPDDIARQMAQFIQNNADIYTRWKEGR